MKKATVKSLGVAALGVALSAVAAGTASAAVTDDVQATTGDVVRTLPALDPATEQLPGGTGDVVQSGTDMLTDDEDEVTSATQTLAHTTKASPIGGLTDPATKLLGGLPVNPTSALGLPTDGLLKGVNLG
ncbi:ATP-binding protein [Streptomyces litchfieldiae]|uniref:ATP-binding protein n=1 Tax=Streptomyces litchfieldiae TaxID=3075543 RepID=A0ABU2N000_9ACTN|nr:ATP-binding protein [Streptomyces sp. DSM 44938]MDT0347216.1 ATP-binding protein [Streptomyces sp. DSM 44938]